jgi:5-formyltetrahydrofolate cyclo-ligase
LDKRAARTLLRDRRDAYVAALGEAGRRDAIAAMRALLAPLAGRPVAAFVALGAEFPILDALVGPVLLPVVDGRHAALRFAEWAPGEPLLPGWAGLLQPTTPPVAQPLLILTPLIGFDRGLNRMGQGAGFYDRYFAAHPDARRIGIAWACQEMDAIPTDPWDVPLDAVVTEQEWIGLPP